MAEADLYRVLREEMAARHWKVRNLSEALGVKFGVASRWVSADPKTRVVPLPDTLVRIAELFDLDVYDVFRHAGYLPAVRGPEEGAMLPQEAEVQALLRRFRRLLRSIPEGQWGLAAVVIGVQLDQLQVLLARLEDYLPPNG